MVFPHKPHMGRIEQRVDAQLGVRPSKLDWLVYRLFRWWWRPLLQKDPTLLGRVERLYLLRLLESYRFATPELTGSPSAAGHDSRHSKGIQV